mgnify:CR=1 FL=1
MNISLRRLVDKSDPEKAVLPAIIFLNLKHSFFETRVKGFALGIGWWHYAIMIVVLPNVNKDYKLKL